MDFPLPRLTEADPELSGEGSLDPLGLAIIAERLAEELLPGVRARMRRVRFLTHASIGALAGEDLFDLPPIDGVSTPSIAFEWLVLEAFGRRPGKDSPLEASGVPGSGKVRTVLAQDKRLSAGNYLKSPSVFGFTGVYLPLARRLDVLDEDRRPGPNAHALVSAWERDAGMTGFADARANTPGQRLRKTIRDQMAESLRAGHCTGKSGAHLWGQICDHLHPRKIGSHEGALIKAWLLSEQDPLRREIALALVGRGEATEHDLAMHLLATAPSAALRVQLDAIVAYENFCQIAMAAFDQLRYLSKALGTRPLQPSHVATDSVLIEACSRLPASLSAAADRIGAVHAELAGMVLTRLDTLGRAQTPQGLMEGLLEHHERIQKQKPPRGKRPWFDAYGSGWIVRSPYARSEPADSHLQAPVFLHPYRLAAMQTFMSDIAS